MVVAHYDYMSQLHFLETWQWNQQQSKPGSQPEGYHIGDMALSGDGSTLVLGVSAFLSPPSNTTATSEIGGACLVLTRQDESEATTTNSTIKQTWHVKDILFTGGGYYGKVSNVAVSNNGTTIALVASMNPSQESYIQVFHSDTDPDGGMQPLGDRLEVGIGLQAGVLTHSSVDDTTQVVLSGDGTRLFVSTRESRIYSLEFNDDEWTPLYGGEVFAETTGAPHVLTDMHGTLLVVGSEFNHPSSPIHVYEPYRGAWHQFATLDIFSTTSTNGGLQWMALSGDGRNIVVCEAIITTPAVSSSLLARWYHRSGSAFVSVQDFFLATPNTNQNTNGAEGDFQLRAMVLDEGGEQLVVAFRNDLVKGYRKDCPNNNDNNNNNNNNDDNNERKS
eukprot:CAMPEP_0116862712 /NCGR_PEP_ID=MMETSP0418-20121206/23794_1 /TAXON_ID=1158023 /ORGANISM="Astrosyne radiata, Strain 13vi08-1A" /LENGTH=389 /DNA_ID=CAMNT_0004497603 /DNA_START=100 /DNA_END=1269 /DNA_ORIENTATION=-